MRHGDLPDGLELQRTTDVFDAASVPEGLLRAHRIASSVWGLVEVLAGSVDFAWEDGPDAPVALVAGDSLVIPPDVAHHVELGPGARFHVSFYRRGAGGGDEQIRTTTGGGELVTRRFDHGGGRDVTVHVPPAPPELIVFAGDGQLIAPWGASLDAADVPPTMIVGVHRVDDETRRLHEYSPGFDPVRFAAFERFFVEEVGAWVRSRFEVDLPAPRTAVLGVSASAELALAMGLGHPDVYGVVFGASPGAGYRPPATMPPVLPRTYLVAGTLEPFFHENATRWATALRDAGADVVMTERVGGHGDAFWQEELPLMVAWAVGGSA